jgi:serine/threonine protein kinase
MQPTPPEFIICKDDEKRGRAGCFSCVYPELYELSKREGIVKVFAIRIDGSEIHEIDVDTVTFFDYLIQFNVCFKIFINFREFITEYRNVMALEAISSNFIQEFTTYHKYVEVESNYYGFKLVFSESIKARATIDHRLYSSGMMGSTKGVYIILNNQCNDKYDIFDEANISKDIVPALRELHKHGFIHNDVHDGNIVHCGDKYKLIDFGSMIKLDNTEDNKPRFEEELNLIKFKHYIQLKQRQHLHRLQNGSIEKNGGKRVMNKISRNKRARRRKRRTRSRRRR